jgi:hypothetical protein
MEQAIAKLHTWASQGAPTGWIVLAAGVALCFVVFNSLRILLYVPQLRTCLQDAQGCPTINLWTWNSWVIANSSTGLYVWIFWGDVWGLLLNLGNATMCAAVVVVTVLKRHGQLRQREPDQAQGV